MKHKSLFILILMTGSSFGQPTGDEYVAKTALSSSSAFTRVDVSRDTLYSSSYLIKSQGLSFGDDVIPTGRSIKDAALFRAQAPSVVLIMTEDVLGSGSLISTDGHILTNKHVVGENKAVGIFFKPDRDAQKVTKDSLVIGKVVKVDDLTDLAIVKVENVPLGRKPVKFGTEEDIGVGLDVHAIGHPKGEYWTYTKGVISQYRPEFEWKGGEHDVGHKANVIQTQTPINPGNSGGPLFLDSGILIGVNSFKNGTAEGLNFAVSIEEVKAFLNRKGDRLISNSAASTSKCEPKVIYKGRTEKNNATLESYELNCSGRKNIDFVYPDDVKAPHLARAYRKSDERYDGIIYSYQRNGKWNFSYWDNNYDNTWSTVGLHRDGELLPASYVSRAEYEKKK